MPQSAQHLAQLLPDHPLSAAQFITQFSDAEEFYRWADSFDEDDRAHPALPMALMSEIHGIGFALACVFHKELGYLNFGKPVVHIRDIFVDLNLNEYKTRSWRFP